MLKNDCSDRLPGALLAPDIKKSMFTATISKSKSMLDIKIDHPLAIHKTNTTNHEMDKNSYFLSNRYLNPRKCFSKRNLTNLSMNDKFDKVLSARSNHINDFELSNKNIRKYKSKVAINLLNFQK